LLDAGIFITDASRERQASVRNGRAMGLACVWAGSERLSVAAFAERISVALVCFYH